MSQVKFYAVSPWSAFSPNAVIAQWTINAKLVVLPWFVVDGKGW